MKLAGTHENINESQGMHVVHGDGAGAGTPALQMATIGLRMTCCFDIQLKLPCTKIFDAPTPWQFTNTLSVFFCPTLENTSTSGETRTFIEPGESTLAVYRILRLDVHCHMGHGEWGRCKWHGEGHHLLLQCKERVLMCNAWSCISSHFI
jgi:hypothetical protein